MKKKTKKKTVKAWAIVTRGGVLIGGGEKHYGYAPLAVYSTRHGAHGHTTLTRPTDVVIPVTITYTV